MPQTLQASQLSLYEVKERFHLQQVKDPAFFSEWQGQLPELERWAVHWLDQARDDFLSLIEHPLHEEIVKLVILAPLLSLAGMCRPPFLPAAEQQVEVTLAEDETLIRGRVDVLVVHQQLWVTVIESKQKGLNVLEALPQALFYMMASPQATQPLFGLITNGTEFLFIKVLPRPTPQYALSEPFSLLRYDNDLCKVLGILRRLAGLVTQAEVA